MSIKCHTSTTWEKKDIMEISYRAMMQQFLFPRFVLSYTVKSVYSDMQWDRMKNSD